MSDRRRQQGLAVAVTLVVVSCTGARGQVGDISDVNWPGWIPSDRVSPMITESATYDGASSLWTYDFVLANEASASQAIESFGLRFQAPDLPGAAATAPAGWRAMLFSQGEAAIPGVSFMAIGPDAVAATRLPAAAQIPPGQQLAGYTLANQYPPGYARAYVQGFAAVPWTSEEELGEPIQVPDDSTNSQRSWTIGPTRYTVVVTGGNRRPATDGFIGFMNLSEKSSVLTDPAPIALKFALNGETVFTNTLSVRLNGVDVTDRFHPGPSDGADLVGVFFLGSSPLLDGKNVLLASVDGVVPGTGRTGTDSDRIVFLVDPALADSGSGSTFALENLPYPEPRVDLEPEQEGR